MPVDSIEQKSSWATFIIALRCNFCLGLIRLVVWNDELVGARASVDNHEISSYLSMVEYDHFLCRALSEKYISMAMPEIFVVLNDI